MHPSVWDAELLSTWDKPDFYALEIQSMAPGLMREEILEYYNLDEYDLSDYDYWFFDANYKRGRIVAKQNVVSKLLANADNPTVAAAYMNRFGKGEWQNRPSGKEAGVKEIKLVLDDGTEIT